MKLRIRKFRDWKIRTKLVAISLTLIIFPLLFGAYLSLQRFTRAMQEYAELDLENVVTGIKELAQAKQILFEQDVIKDLKVARHILSHYADFVTIHPDRTAKVRVLNPPPGERQEITVPFWSIGSQPITLDSRIAEQTHDLTGSHMLILQRLPDDGMLVLSTSLKREDGTPAVGILIPAKSDITRTVLEGKRYVGRFNVANTWYLAAVEPFRDSGGLIIGAIGAVIKEQLETALKRSILKIRVGETGYAYVLDNTGTLVIHPAKEGKNIISDRDPDGFEFIRAMVTRAPRLSPGSVGTIRYPWMNPELGDTRPRMKIVKYAYFQPWEWIIAAGSYEDEIFYAVRQTRSFIFFVAITSLLVAIALSLVLARFLSRPILKLTEVTGRMAGGDLSQSVDIDSGDEIGLLARSFNLMANQVRDHTTTLEKMVEKRTEELRESREKYRNLSHLLNNILESSTEYSIIATDMSGNILEYNSGSARIFGWSKAEMIGIKGIPMTLRDEDRDSDLIRTLARKVMKQGVTEQEMIRRRKNGETFPVNSIITALRNTEGKIYGFLEIARDISEKKRLEKELWDTKEYLENILESTPDGVVTTDPKGIITYVNRGMEAMIGWPKERLIGVHISRFYLNGIDEARNIMKILRERERHRNYEITMVVEGNGRKRRIIPILTSNALLKDETGQIIGTMGVFKDLSEQKKLEEQLRRTMATLIQAGKMRALGDLVAGVAHELNNPLMASTTLLHVIDENMPRDDPNRKRLEVIEQCNKRIGKIVSQLRDFSRQSRFEFLSVDVNKAFENVLTMTSQQLMNHNIRVVKRFQPDLPRVMGDGNQLEQVFLNLISNARDAMENAAKKTLTIETRARPENGTVEVTIKDSGCGIPRENMDKIFDPFFSTKEVGKGTGLGLSICYSIIELHGGKIEVDSRVGRGSRFRIFLPIPEEGDTDGEKDSGG
ncbi:MAG: Cache 3/Cache 2 fusion domain-containing protein [Deltaproteobacteria bacterium]|nr:Cache 3/Cache 2 fusion domain-containing protein [Deltaproteobacteria bacterium]